MIYIAPSLLSADFSNLESEISKIAQAPKLAPHIPQMRKNFALLFGIDEDRINIKATTEEHLGFTGEGLGIAAHAVCLLLSES